MSPATATAPARAPRSSPARPRTAPAHRPAPAPAKPDLYVVKPTPTRKPSTGKGRLGIISVGLVFVVAFAIAILQTVIVQGQMHLDDLQQQISDTQAESQRLQLEAADLSSPTHIVEEAQQMGMVAAPGGVTFVNTVDGDAPATTPTLPATDPPATQLAASVVDPDETAAAAPVTTPTP